MERKALNRKMFKSLALLSLPTMLEYLLSTLMQYVDTAMVGRLGADATAAVSTTTTITWLTGNICAAVAVAVLTMIAMQIGAGQTDTVKTTAAQALLLSVATGTLIMAVSVILSPFIPGWMGVDLSVRVEAAAYFRIISLSMVFRSMSIVLGAAVRATHDTKTPMIINLTANGLNVLLNALFIYGLDMGVRGAASATALSTSVAGLWTLVVFFRNRMLRFEKERLKPDATILKECTRIGSPVLATGITSCMGYVVFASMITRLGNVIFAAHSIAVTAEEFFYLPGYGLRSATQTMVGNAVGEEDTDKLKSVSFVSICFTVFLMCLSGGALFFAAGPLMRFFTSSDEVALIGAGLLKMVALSEPFFGLQVVLEGICYGLGKTKLPFFIHTLSMWCVRILFTYLCIHVWGFGIRAVWVCMIADNLCKALLSAGMTKHVFRGLFQKISSEV
ncbi:MAG: MATE family efflux transporter [Lachnospiraceae bacterium]|nr:MATE family efflux transporter [Lachnospiraceae bacterium]